MTAVRLGIGTEVVIEDQVFAVRRSLSDSLIQLEEEDSGQILKLGRRQLAVALAEGKAEIKTKTRSNVRGAKADLSALPKKEQEEVQRRLTYIKLVETPEISATGKQLITESIKRGAERLGDLSPPSPATLYSWLKAYRSASRDACALIPRTRGRGNRRRRLCAEVIEALETLTNERFLVTTRPRASDIYSALIVEVSRLNRLRFEDDQIQIPSMQTVYRHIKSIEPYRLLEGRFGKMVADRETRHVGDGARSTRPLERVEIDHTPLDIVVVAENGLRLGRPTLTMVIDHFSRMPLGHYIGFTPPSTAAVMLALRCAIQPKDWIEARYPEIRGKWPCYGIPETLVTDNGAEFHSTDLELACAQLGITIQHTKVKAPWTKGVVERFLGELNRANFGAAPGKTFHSSEARGEYDAVGEACVPFSQLELILCKWIVDVHSRKNHKGINGIPGDFWENGVDEFPPRLFASHEDLNVLLSSCRESRNLHPNGITLEGLWYRSRKLTELRNSTGRPLRVEIKFDPMNLGRIHVLDPRYDCYFEVPAADQEYAEGLGLWQHKVTRRHQREMQNAREDIVSIAEAKEEIHREIHKHSQAANRKTTNTKLARFLEAGGSPNDRLSGDPTGGPGSITPGLLPDLEQDKAVFEESWFDDMDDGDEDFIVPDMNRVQAAGKD